MGYIVSFIGRFFIEMWVCVFWKGILLLFGLGVVVVFD